MGITRRLACQLLLRERLKSRADHPAVTAARMTPRRSTPSSETRAYSGRALTSSSAIITSREHSQARIATAAKTAAADYSLFCGIQLSTIACSNCSRVRQRCSSACLFLAIQTEPRPQRSAIATSVVALPRGRGSETSAVHCCTGIDIPICDCEPPIESVTAASPLGVEDGTRKLI